jgi:hypothetical protein
MNTVREFYFVRFFEKKMFFFEKNLDFFKKKNSAPDSLPDFDCELNELNQIAFINAHHDAMMKLLDTNKEITSEPDQAKHDGVLTDEVRGML